MRNVYCSVSITYRLVIAMTDKPKRVPTSLRVVAEMYETAKQNCMKKHGRTTSYGSVDASKNRSPENCAFIEAKEKIITKVSEEIEAEVIKKYSKYGIISVPLCHRRSDSGDDRLHIDLKMKKFPGCEKEQGALDAANKRYISDMKDIEKWHMDALQAVAKKEELPALPEINP